MPISKVVLTVTIVAIIQGCSVKDNSILPSVGAREQSVAAYEECVSTMTYNIFDKSSDPEIIVGQSMKLCTYMRDAMLKGYPRRWREPYLKKIDTALHKREITWILENRNK